jgi:diguanylate cyclase (GGDEF)-like protein
MIRDPLQRVQRVAELAADGDLTAHVGVSSNDETGRLARSFNAMLERLRNREQALRVDHHRQELAGQVHRALEIADDEGAALDVISRALSAITDDRPAELQLADNSKAHLHQAVVSGRDPRGPGCPVESPFSCAAVRNGTAMTFASSEALDSCPHLRGRAGGACSAVCVPVTFMGRAMGVLHTVGDDGAPPSEEEAEHLTMLSTQVGARIGMLRSMRKTQMQATTDGLTGLMNRRTFESRVRALHRSRAEFTLVMADLDHFKLVNDTYGHDAGDRALRLFAEVASTAVRDSDLVARWGGEEFALAFPDSDPEQTKDVLDRLRLELAARLGNGDLRPFTVSFGLTAGHDCATLEHAVRLADNALYQAKEAGRDRAVIAASPPAASPPASAAAESPATALATSVLAAIARDDDAGDF